MRQLVLQVPARAADEAVAMARRRGATTLSRLPGADGRGDDVAVLVATVPNAAVGPLLQDARSLGEVEASMASAGALAFEPPAGQALEELLDVTARSPIEVALAGRQAAGGWPGFLVYAATSGIVVWLGLFTETVYLLTGAMLLAPFAGPAMTTAIAVSGGRPALLRQSLLRYAVGIGMTAAVAGALTLVSGQEVPTSLMTSVMTITYAAVLLPVAAGVAGAMYLVQSEHSSLISGAAVGILVAASLAPPAGGTGMALVLGRPSLALHGTFLIALQLAAITASAVVVLRLHGLRAGSTHGGGTNRWLLPAGLAVAVVTVGALLALQVASAPTLVQGSLARDAAAQVTAALRDRPDVALMAVDPRVASAGVDGPPRILVDVEVERLASAAPAEDLRPLLEGSLTDAVREAVPSVVPHVTVTVHEPPGG